MNSGCATGVIFPWKVVKVCFKVIVLREVPLISILLHTGIYIFHKNNFMPFIKLCHCKVLYGNRIAAVPVQEAAMVIWVSLVHSRREYIF